MDARTRAGVVRRLAYIEGHLGGVRKMIDANQSCAKVLEQTFAVRRGLKRLDATIVSAHLHGCLIDGAEHRGRSRIEDVDAVCGFADHLPRSA